MKYTLAVILVALFASAVNGQWERLTENPFPEYSQIPVDTLILNGYEAVTYNCVDSLGRSNRYNVLRVFKRQKELIVVYDGISEMFNLCRVLPYIKDNCYLQDINGDGIDEIVIEYSTGGGSCCEGAGYVFSVGDTSKLLLEMKPTIAGFEIVDIENDSMPEIITWDDTFTSFLDYPYRAFIQRIIWRWDGNKYRVANGRFADYLLDALGPNQMPPIEKIGNPMDLQITVRKYVKAPTFDFWNMILAYYLVGRPEKADSLFKQYWPSEAPDKEIYYSELKKRINYDSLWPQVLNSNW